MSDDEYAEFHTPADLFVAHALNTCWDRDAVFTCYVCECGQQVETRENWAKHLEDKLYDSMLVLP